MARPKKILNCDLDAYAAVMEEMRDTCIARNKNFRAVMLGLATTWMRDKDAPARPASLPAADATTTPAAATRPTERTDDVMRQSIVKSEPAREPVAVAVAAGAGLVLTRGLSPAAQVMELLTLRERVDAELGRLMVAMGIPVATVSATTPAPAATPVTAASEDEAAAPVAREKRTYTRRAPAGETAGSIEPPAKKGHSRKAKPVACDDFPGRVFTYAEVRDLAGLGPTIPIGQYVKNGYRINGKYLFRFATAQEIAAASGGNAQVPAAPAADDDADDDDAGESGGGMASDGKRTKYECLNCFTEVRLSRPPSKCARCGSGRFRVAPQQAAAI